MQSACITPESTEHPRSKSGSEQLKPLTALRFIAAAMIVAHHAKDSLGLDPHHVLEHIFLNHGVSFFFVLSGFILTYVYPHLSGWQQAKEFLIARWARIWPSHIVSGLWWVSQMSPVDLRGGGLMLVGALIANLFLVQAWIPSDKFFYSGNPVSWSISTEFFFYLAFIVLMLPLKSFGWPAKLSVAFFLAMLSVLTPYLLWGPSLEQMPQDTFLYFTYISPFARLLEFVLGMFTASMLLKLRDKVRLTKASATSFEIIVLAATVWCLCGRAELWLLIKQFIHPVSILTWLQRVISAPLFALLIFIMAFQRGYVSKALSHPVAIWLGEISYSIYLFHLVILMQFIAHQRDFACYNRWLVFAAYFALVILVSHLNYRLIECPFRRLIKDATVNKDSSTGAGQVRNWRKRPRLSTVVAALLMLSLTGMLVFSVEASQARFGLKPAQVDKPIVFGNNLALQQVEVGRTADEVKMRIHWQNLSEGKLKYALQLQYFDKNFKLVAAHYLQKNQSWQSLSGQKTWTDTVYKELPGQARNLEWFAITVFDPHSTRFLRPDGGNTDTEGNSLILNFR